MARSKYGKMKPPSAYTWPKVGDKVELDDEQGKWLWVKEVNKRAYELRVVGRNGAESCCDIGHVVMIQPVNG